MALDTTIAQVRKIIIESTGQDGDWVTPKLKLGEVGDALDRVETIMAIEITFGVEIADAEFCPHTTIEELAEMVERKTGSRREISF